MPNEEQPVVNPAPKVKQFPVAITVIGVIVLIAAFSAAAYYIGVKGIRFSVTSNQKNGQEQVTNTPNPTVAPQDTPLFTGTLTRHIQDLQIYKLTDSDKANGLTSSDFIYYDAGIFTRGELKDYTRVIAIRPAEGPGDPSVYILATKDFQTYILNDPDNATVNYPQDDWNNPYNVLDKTKITATKTFETEQPKELDLDKNFALYFEKLPIESADKALLTTDFSSYQKLTSPLKDLTIYFKPYTPNNTYANQMSAADKAQAQLKQKYFLGDTEVVVVDSVGLPVTYALTTPLGIKTYNIRQAQYLIDSKNYDAQVKLYDAKKISTYPTSPEYVYLPNMGFKGSTINSTSGLKFYNDYESAVPDACAFTLNSRVVNVTDSDLEQVVTVFSMPLYHLKDTKSSFYTLAFNNKFSFYNNAMGFKWDDVNKGIKQPNLDEYVSMNPLLFVKDYWNRWVALGEYDIKLPGGCGKPVVYLYPTKPTQVTVQFQTPIQFTTDIPTYADSWKVMAYPNGSLVNLKPELTDCSKIDTSNKGAEYAKAACEKNTYPYLYWAGNVNSETYPVTNAGWIVEKNNLSEFINSKLTEIGFNENEKNDFTSYWISEMLSKNAPYYKISFLQTPQLNTLFPMNVTPTPDTTFRIFMDYTPLTSKPTIMPEPQVLNKLIRNGFTLVEWGGLKQR